MPRMFEVLRCRCLLLSQPDTTILAQRIHIHHENTVRVRPFGDSGFCSSQQRTNSGLLISSRWHLVNKVKQDSDWTGTNRDSQRTSLQAADMTCRASTTLRQMNSSSRRVLEFPTLLHSMATMRRHTTEQLRTVRLYTNRAEALVLFAPEKTRETDLWIAQNPACPSGIMQWQHGTYVINANGSLTLTPIAVDGRQLLSTPCDYENGIYTRYNQSELFLVRLGSSAKLSVNHVLILSSSPTTNTPTHTTTFLASTSTNSTVPH